MAQIATRLIRHILNDIMHVLMSPGLEKNVDRMTEVGLSVQFSLYGDNNAERNERDQGAAPPG